MASATPGRGAVVALAAVFVVLLAAGCADRWLADAPRASPPDGCPPGTLLDTTEGRCVARGCASDDDCRPGLRCDRISASCVSAQTLPDGVGVVPQPRICDEGARRCDRGGSSGVELCIDGGWALEACPSGLSCSAGRCVACDPGEHRCGPPGVVETCALDGSAWVAEACPGAQPICMAGSCRTCEPGAALCEGTVGMVVCNALGTGWEARSCGPGTRCMEEGSAASCRTVACTPGARRCDPANPSVQELCSEDGSGWIANACASGQTCEPTAGSCVDACGLAAAIRSSDGCGFTFANQPNASALLARSSSLTLLVRNGRQEPVRLQLWHAGVTAGDSLHLAPGQTIPVDVPAGDAGWRLESSGPVTVQLVNRAEGLDAVGCGCLATGCASEDPCLTFDRSSDATLLLPEHLLGRSADGAADYLVFSTLHQRDGGERPALLSLVGGAAPSSALITFGGPARRTVDGVTTSWNAGDVAAFAVGPYEVLQFTTAPGGTVRESVGGSRPRTESENGLTGTRIATAGPVAVFAGADCSRAPLQAAACDHVEAQLFPKHLWGRRYVGMRYGDGDRWFVGAGDDDTLVLFSRPVDVGDGTAPRLVTVPAGTVLEFRTNGDFELLAWAPVTLGQLAGSPTTGAQASLVIAQPAERFQESYRLLLPRSGTRTLHLQAPVGDGAVPQVLVAGVAVSGWTKINSGLQVARVPLCAGAGSPCDPEGVYVVESAEPVGLTAWVEEGGYAPESRSTFGFVGGLGGDPSVVRPQPY